MKKILINNHIIIFYSLIALIYAFFGISIIHKINFFIIFFVFFYLLFWKTNMKHIYCISLLLSYFIICFFIKYNEYGFINSLKYCYNIFKIISIPLLIYSLLFLIKDKINKRSNYFIYIISILFIITQIIYMIINNIFTYDSIVFFLLTMLFITKNNKDNRLIELVLLLLTIILCIIIHNYLGILVIIIYYIINILFEKSKYLKSDFVIILLCVCSLLLMLNNDLNNINTSTNKYSIVNDYEFIDDTSINSNNIICVYRTNYLKGIMFGLDYNLIKSDYNVLNCLYYLGIVGFVLLVLSIVLLLKTYLNKKTYRFLIPLTLFICFSSEFNFFYIYIINLIIALNMNKETLLEKDEIKKRILLIIVLCFAILGFISNKFFRVNSSNNNTFELSLFDDLKCIKNCHLFPYKTINNEDVEIKETITAYNLKSDNKHIATIIHSIREYKDIRFDFISILNKDNDIKLKLILTNDEIKEIENFDSYNIEHHYDYTVGLNKLKLPIGLYNFDNKYAIIGQTFTYTTLVSKYEDNNKSTIYNLINQNYDLTGIYKIMDVPSNTNADTYIIQSKKNYFKKDKDLQDFIDVINTKSSSWMTYMGNMNKVQYSIDPFTREGYGKNLGQLIEDKIYEISLNNNNSIYKALSANAIYSLYHYTPRINDNGIWLTNYTSTWLSKDYGTKAFYVDTRYNETIGYLLLEKYKETNNFKYKKSFLVYADFIIDKWKNESHYIDKSRMLEDYFSTSNTSKTHSSLNHQLALVNYLFKAHEITNEEEYYNVAKEMLNNILLFEKQWIKESGDLWYSVKSDGIFYGNDYEFVTLEDLLFTQRYLVQFDKKQNETINKLIKSKVKYLKKNNKIIPSFDQKMMKELIII